MSGTENQRCQEPFLRFWHHFHTLLMSLCLLLSIAVDTSGAGYSKKWQENEGRRMGFGFHSPASVLLPIVFRMRCRGSLHSSSAMHFPKRTRTTIRGKPKCVRDAREQSWAASRLAVSPRKSKARKSKGLAYYLVDHPYLNRMQMRSA